MHCNQSFLNSFGNGPGYGYNPYNTPQPNNGPYPEIVGEGEVTSVTLPDGTVQLFFTPTIKWMTPNAFPFNNMNNNMIGNPYWNIGVGTWYVRTITSPRFSPTFSNTQSARYEAPRPLYYSDCNLNANNGYPLKFHNDQKTSTTDIIFFYPYLRQFDCTFTLPAQGCAAVQVNTPAMTNTVCHYEAFCPNPCFCTTKQSHNNSLPKLPSAMSLDEIKTKSDNICANCPECHEITKTETKSKYNICACSSKPYETTNTKAGPSYSNSLDKPVKSKVEFEYSCDNVRQLQLQPLDSRNKRIKLRIPKQEKQETPRDASCECTPPLCLDKSIATIAEQSSGGNKPIKTRNKNKHNDDSDNSSICSGCLDLINNKKSDLF